MRINGTWGSCIWMLSEQGELQISGGVAESIISAADVPWNAHRSEIISVRFEGEIRMDRGSSLNCLFEGCDKLTRADMQGLNTSGIVGMKSMFANCVSLTAVNFDGVDLSTVKDLSWMFYNCENLTGVHMSDGDMRSADDISHMFQYCDNLKLIGTDSITLTDGVNVDRAFEGSNVLSTVKIRLIDADQGGADSNYDDIEMFDAEIIDVDARTIDVDVDADVNNAIMTDVAHDPLVSETSSHSEELIRIKSEGSKSFKWAGAPFFVSRIEQIPPITYGERLKLKPPYVDNNNADELHVYVEISPDGENGWTPLDPKTILDVSVDGYYLRYKAVNPIGVAFSESSRISIRKADYDLSDVHWVGPENAGYDGSEKSVGLIGLPQGVTAVYSGNCETLAGEYVASAKLEYDRVNYNSPAVENYTWRINRADYFMGNVAWDYVEPYVYDGHDKTVELIGLPDGVYAEYIDNEQKNAGIYYATVKFQYDERNFNPPATVEPCQWQILKTEFNMQGMNWQQDRVFTYTGLAQRVLLEGVPEDIIVTYAGNTQVDCGKYVAVASFSSKLENYIMPESVQCEWQIVKADIDMSRVEWNYSAPFTYDGTEKYVYLQGLPAGLSVQYKGNMGIGAGEYFAIAKFFVDDEFNINTPEDIMLEWSVIKSDYDLSSVFWNYTEPFTYDGSVKQIALVNLPVGITPEYQGASQVNAGEYFASAELYYDEKNYNKPEVAGCAWAINKAECNMSNARWITAFRPVYDGSVHTIQIAGLPDIVNVEYVNNANTDAGEYITKAILTVADPDNYIVPEMKPCRWKIDVAEPDMMNVRWDYIGDFEFDGTRKTVRLNNVPDDLAVEYTDNEAIVTGQYKATAVFTSRSGNYRTPDPMECEWRIVKGSYDMSKTRWDYPGVFVYDGEQKTVRLAGLPIGVHAEYSDNTGSEVGRYSTTVKLSVDDPVNYHVPRFSGLVWYIQKADYDMDQVRWSYSSPISYDGDIKTVELQGLPAGIVPVYMNNTGLNVGDYTASVNLEYDEHNYNKPIIPSCRWRIDKGIYNVSTIRWDYDSPFVFDGQMKRVELIGLSNDVTVRYEMNKAADAGIYEAKAYLTLKDKDNYEDIDVMVLTWEIKKANVNMSSVLWAYSNPFVYNGNAHVVSLRNLPEGVWADYDSNVAVDVGVYEAKATFGIVNRENYVVPESMSCLWEVKKAEVDMSRVHWNYSKEFTYDGTAHELSLVGLPRGVNVVYTENRATAAGTYEANAEFVLNDDWNFYNPSIKGIKWTVAKADFDMSEVRWDYTGAKTFNGEVQSVSLMGLPQGVIPHYYGNEATKSGTYEATVTFTVEDEKNYNIPVFESCRWRIDKANYDMSEATWQYAEDSLVYDGTLKTIEIAGLPEGVVATYSGNSQIKAGSYTAIANFSVADPMNYNIPQIDTCRWRINRATFDISDAYWDCASEYVYDGLEKVVRIANLPDGITATYAGANATNAGKYIASAMLHVDAENYCVPHIQSCEWEIKRAKPDIGGARWDYMEPFSYDGRQKKVSVVDLPQGMSVIYKNNVCTAAGEYIAEAVVMMDDKINFIAPEIENCSWEIKKSKIDMSDVCWTQGEAYVYNGVTKRVWLKNLPDGIVANYSGNVEIDAGDHYAEVEFEYDANNYIAGEIGGYSWKIEKAVYDMSATTWNYSGSFTYDGAAKSVELMGLPAGVSVEYSGNVAVDAGKYEAVATLHYDERNYHEPVVETCKWEILKATPDVSGVRWDYTRSIPFDGEIHYIELVREDARKGLLDKMFGAKEDAPVMGLPDGVTVEMQNNYAADAGKYIARAVFTVENEANYIAPEPIECRWEISKIDPDMSGVYWAYEQAFEYDGKEKKVRVKNLPECVKVKFYDNNSGIDVGTYTARVEFKVDAKGNYNQPEGMTLCWRIDRKTLDMRTVRWNYDKPFIYDGEIKSIELLNLPEEISVNYINTSAVDPGTYVAKAVLRYDKSSYNVLEPGDCKWKIEQEQ